MTEKELHKLSRSELLEMLVEQTKKVEILESRLKIAQDELNDRVIRMEKAGNIANAALQLNKVFEAAQAAGDQYILGLKNLYEKENNLCQLMEENVIKEEREEFNKKKSSSSDRPAITVSGFISENPPHFKKAGTES
jgi:hypothetical protein